MSVETRDGSPVNVERFARVFVKGPEELPSHADTYYDPDRGYYFKLHLNGVSVDEASPLVSKARERFDVELVRRVTQDGFYKERVYVDSPSEVPDDKKVHQGPSGGIYYETGVERVGIDSESGETRNVAVIHWEDVELGDEIVFEPPGGEEAFAEIVDIEPTSEGPDVIHVQVDGETYEAQPGTYTVANGEEKSEGSLTTGTEGVHNPVHSSDLPNECRECGENERMEGSFRCEECADDTEKADFGSGPSEPRVYDLGKQDGQWVSFVGPRGGEGWVNLQTGEKRYQKQRPGDGPEGVDEGEFPEGWDEPPEDFGELEVGQQVELYDQAGDEYYEAEVVGFEEGRPEVESESIPGGGIVVGEMQTSLTAVEEDYDRHDSFFDDKDITPEQYWGAVEDEIPPDAAEELQQFEVGQEVAVDLPGEDEPVSLPVYGFVDGDDEHFPASKDSLVFHYDDLEEAVGTETMHDRWGEPGDASPTITGPPGSIGDVVLGPAEEYETQDDEPEGSDEDEASWDEQDLGEDEWLAQQDIEPGTAFNYEGQDVQVVGATSMVGGELSHAVVETEDGTTIPLHPNSVPETIDEGPLEGQVETAHDPGFDSDNWKSIDDVEITDLPEGSDVIVEGDGYYTTAETYPSNIGFDPGDGDTLYPEDVDIVAVHEDDVDALSEDEESDEGQDTPSGEEVEPAVAEPASEGIEALDQADPESFNEAVQSFADANPDLAVMLTFHDPEELEDHDLFLSEEGDAGVAVSPDGDIQNVFSTEDADVDGDEVMEQAIAAGGQTLDCYDGFLTDFYESHGFDVTGTMDFNPDVAPEGWEENPHLEDQPDVMFMAHEAGDVGEVPTYDGSEWSEAKLDSQRAANTGEDSGAEGGGVGEGERGSDTGSGEDGGNDEVDGVHPAQTEDYDLTSYDPDDVEEFRDMSDIGASHGNSVAAMDVAVLPDGSKAVHKDVTHHSVTEDDIKRETAGYEAAKHLDTNVPVHAADVDAGWAVSEVVPGVDAKDATPEMKEAVETEDFVDMAAKQVIIGNSDLHQNNLRVDENGNLYPFDLDRSAGDVTGDWVGNLEHYDDTLDRILGEMEKSANALGVSSGPGFREAVIERAEEVANGIDGPTAHLIQEDVAEVDEGFAETIAQNIVALANGEVSV